MYGKYNYKRITSFWCKSSKGFLKREHSNIYERGNNFILYDQIYVNKRGNTEYDKLKPKKPKKWNFRCKKALEYDMLCLRHDWTRRIIFCLKA